MLETGLGERDLEAGHGGGAGHRFFRPALLSLTVIRVVLIFVSLTGIGESVSSRLFLGWFERCVLASIVFAIIVINADVPEGRFLALVVICTVFMSLIAHGISAHPLAK